MTGAAKAHYDGIVAFSQTDFIGTLKTYKGFPHGMPITQADTINKLDAEALAPSSRS